MTTNIRFGFCEVLALFAIGALWHNFALAIACISLAGIGAFFRVAMDIQKETKAAQARQDAAKLLNEQVGEFGQTIGTILGSAKQTKKKKTSGGGFH